MGKLHKKTKDLTGMRFGCLTVIKFDGYRARSTGNLRYAMWLCRCDSNDSGQICGATTSIAAYNLINGNSTRCKRCGRLYVIYGRKTGSKHFSGSHLARYRRGAEDRDIAWQLSCDDIDDVFESQDLKCALGGDILIGSAHFIRTEESQATASIDRIRSIGGIYEKGNIQIVHKDLNRLKMATPNQEFIDICHKISEYQMKLTQGRSS